MIANGNSLARWLRCALVAVGLTASLSACTGRERFASNSDDSEVANLSDGYVAVFDLSSGAPEQAPGGFFQLPPDRTYVSLVRELIRAQKDEDAKSIYVRLSQQNYDWAQSQELGRLLGELRKKQKFVTCHAHSLTNSTVWLFLRGCDKIWLSPAGEVTTVGIAAQMTYLKGALDRLKIHADFLHMGRFKSGGEPMTQEGPSEASRQNLTNTLRSIRQIWLDDATRVRKREGVKRALESGPFVPEEAKKRGLIDAIGFESEAIAEAKKKGDIEGSKVLFGPGRKQADSGLTELVRILAGSSDDSSTRDHIAVVPAVGGITMSGSEGLGGNGITASAMVKTLRRLKKSNAVKAVVIRLDSPGGSPLASDLIWHELMELKKEKPVIASVGGMAASGGYYIACAADKIVAEPSSIVGSIGVFGGKFVVGDALEQLGITSYTFPASPEPGAAARAAYLSPLTPWDDATRSRVEDSMRHIYRLFIQRVAKGRGMSESKVEATAEGAIFSGLQGRDRGLVDELGGLARALEIARARGKLPDDMPVVIEGLQESLIESLFSGGGPVAGDVEARAIARQAEVDRWNDWVPRELQAFVSSVLPLTQGEHSVTALPFVFVMR